MHFKVSSAKRRPFCPGLNVLNVTLEVCWNTLHGEYPLLFEKSLIDVFVALNFDYSFHNIVIAMYGISWFLFHV